MSLAADPTGERHWTAEDYMNLDDDQRHEVLAGELLRVPSPNIYHQRAITNLGTLINAHALDHDLDACFDAPFDVVLFEDTVAQPDFTFVRKERLAELYDGHCLSGAPDLLIEVLSPATERRDRHQTRQLYARACVEGPRGLAPRVTKPVQLAQEHAHRKGPRGLAPRVTKPVQLAPYRPQQTGASTGIFHRYGVCEISL